MIQVAKISKRLSRFLLNIFIVIKSSITLILSIDEQNRNILNTVEEILRTNDTHYFVMQVRILDSISSIALFSAVALMCEIGDFSAFKNAKQLFAYFDIKPSVNESMNFKGTKNHMSKRGSKLARRILFSATLSSVRTSRNSVDVNSVLKAYYKTKTDSKPKKIALGAVMHKLCNIIFVVLTTSSNFVVKIPE